MTEHEIAARAALSDLMAFYETQLTRATAALTALNGDAAATIVDEDQAPAGPVRTVEVGAPDRTSAVVGGRTNEERRRSAGAAAKVTVVCESCGRTFSQMGITSHRRTHAETFVEGVLRKATDPSGADAPDTPVPATSQFRCGTCELCFDANAELAQHTIRAHGRGPSSAENKPFAA